MPKNYQISQYDLPICLGGAVPLHDLAYPKDAQKSIAAPDKKVGLVRIHLEEDVAKSFHYDTSTGIDFNRAGTPLMEIVTQPEIGSPEEAFAFLTALRQILLYGGVSDADMEKGQMRCDCNVSVRPEGQVEFGEKIEIKNMNTRQRRAQGPGVRDHAPDRRTGSRAQARAGDPPLGRCQRADVPHAHEGKRARLPLFPRPRPDAGADGTASWRRARAGDARVARRQARAVRRPTTASARTTPPCWRTTRRFRRTSRRPPTTGRQAQERRQLGAQRSAQRGRRRGQGRSAIARCRPPRLSELVDLIDAGQNQRQAGQGSVRGDVRQPANRRRPSSRKRAWSNSATRARWRRWWIR